jgi:hypothetical protein
VPFVGGYGVDRESTERAAELGVFVDIKPLPRGALGTPDKIETG